MEKPIEKTDAIMLKDAITIFEKIGQIIDEGEKRGFKKQEILQLIITGVIKL